MADQIIASIGFHGCHGLSAAFDFRAAIEASRLVNTFSDDPLNILLVNPGDIRHVFLTISRRRRGTAKHFRKLRPLHFYLMESPVEVLTRDLFLLEVLHDFEVPIRQRANVFLEIYGNCRVQCRTSRYIEQLGYQLRELLTRGTGRLEDSVNFSLMRYKDKDEIEAALGNYSSKVEFDIDRFRDQRIRGLYKERYDNRFALFDWDYHNNIKAKASIIHIKQYLEWRKSGIAFEFGDQSYTEPNRTMISYTEGIVSKGRDKGLKKEVRGLWTDVVASPYFSFGIDCDAPNSFAEGLHEILNKNSGSEQHRHNTVEVALHNIISYLWELETGLVYKMSKIHDVFSGLGAEGFPCTEDVDMDSNSTPSVMIKDTKCKDRTGSTGSVDNNQMKCSTTVGAEVSCSSDDSTTKGLQYPPSNYEVPDIHLQEESNVQSVDHSDNAANDCRKTLEKQIERAEFISESMGDIKIFPMTGGSSQLDKAMFTNMFDGIFISARSVQYLEKSCFQKILKGSIKEKDDIEGGTSLKGLIAIETAKFIVPLSKKEQGEFNRKEEDFAASRGWKKIPPPVPRRRRDELDLEDDVVFFTN